MAIKKRKAGGTAKKRNCMTRYQNVEKTVHRFSAGRMSSELRLNLSVQNTWLSSRFLYRIHAGYHSALGMSVPVLVTLGLA